ncbi:fatty acid-binding protein DegV [Fervidobacterium thailandense]|uniref:Fatty acid-binding protein DegV n=1 Tax=Fervidobacterium thailandense TaxID=1008305 RepID=A0A1E3G0J8_9BACT|nr:fatty acid-binding protein DegV [Fervidobacterium thailandense]
MVVDSTTPLPGWLDESVPVFSVPVRVYIDGQEYKDQLEIQDKIIQAIKEERMLETSLPAPNDVEELFEKLSEEYDRVYVLSVSSHLSGTYNLFGTIASKYENIVVFDSKTISIQNTYILARMIEDIKAGKVLEEDDIISYRDDSLFLIAVFNISRLEKSGRIGKLVSIIGKILHVKPVLTIARTGEVELVGKALGKSKVMELIFDKVQEFLKGENGNVKLYAAVGTDEYKEFIFEIGSFLDVKPTFFPIGSAVLAHVGLDGFGIVVAK